MKIRPGVWLLRFKQRFGKGLRVAWYRDRVRPRILQTGPIRGLNDETAEVHVLTSRDDWLNLVWTLKSFYRVSDKPYRLVIHEDGTLPPETQEALKGHFPEARLVFRAEADAASRKALQDYPKALHFRTTNNLSLKIFDFPLFLEADRMILLDSDVLFFRRPDVLLDRIADANYLRNTVNGDVSGALTVEPETVKER